MKNIEIGSVKMPLNDFIVSRNAILGITKSGKTFTAKSIAEQMLEQKVPIIVFDAIGVWRYLKVPGHGKGFQIVVAGGAQPDLPLTPHSAPEIVRAAIRENIPLVIDLYDPKLSKADWRRIVQDSFRILLYENTGLRHIFLEEAAEYAPQKVIDGQTYAEVEKLARMGGNRSLGITFINQRAQELNKAVLELCDNIILLRQRGTHAIDSLERQMDKLSPEMAQEIALTMPNMTAGDCWIFTENGDRPVRTKSKMIQSFHPDRRRPEEKQLAAQSVNTDQFVQAMTGKLTEIIAESKANDPAELRREIARLKKEATKIAPAKTETKEVPTLTDAERKRLTKLIETFEDFTKTFNTVRTITEIIATAKDQASEDLKWLRDLLAGKLASKPAQITRPLPVAMQPRLAIPSQPPEQTNGDVETTLGRGAREILKAAAQHPDGVTESQIAVLTGYKQTSRRIFRQQLCAAGYLEKGGRGFMATESGIAWLGSDFEPLPTGEALREHWLNKLSGGELELFKIFIECYPEEVSDTTIMERTGYKQTSVRIFRQNIAARNLIEGKRASKNIFE